MTTSTEAAPQTVSGFATTPLFDRNDGTFFKPAPSSTAEHCINFWSNVAIPDQIVTQLENVYYNTRLKQVQKQIDDQTEAWAQQWIAANPKPKRTSNVAEWDARFDVERKAFMDPLREELQSKRPMKLGMYDSRQLVRAAQMLYHAPSPNKFPVQENIKVWDHQIELYREVLTVEQIQTTYSLYDLHYCLERVFQDNTLANILDELQTHTSILGVTRDMKIEEQRVQGY